MKYLATIPALTIYGITWYLALNPENLIQAEYAHTVGIIAGAIWWILTATGAIALIRSAR
jgi:hypothetical protein